MTWDDIVFREKNGDRGFQSVKFSHVVGLDGAGKIAKLHHYLLSGKPTGKEGEWEGGEVISFNHLSVIRNNKKGGHLWIYRWNMRLPP